MSDYPTARNSERSDDTRRRMKLAIMMIVFGPIVLASLVYIGVAVKKMIDGTPVGYQQRDHRAAQVD